MIVRRFRITASRSCVYSRSIVLAAFVASLAGCTVVVPGAGATGDAAGTLNPDFQPTLDLRLRAQPTEVQILDGSATTVLTYAAEVLSGNPASVTPFPGSYLGPVIRARTGDRLRVRLENRLDDPTIIHWHGMRVPAEQDGHPRYAIDPGDEFVYEFEVRDQAATYWFHPHAHGFTAGQVYGGLAGLLLVSDSEEDAAVLPTGEFDVPLVIQDRMFDESNQLVYPPMMDMMTDGFLGDHILVNGRPDYELAVATRVYRLRLVNGSNSRTYKLAWSVGTPLIVIASDGGLLERPLEREYVTLGPGERIELWADFSQFEVGREFSLESLAFSGADFGLDGMSTDGMHMDDGEDESSMDEGDGMHGGMKAMALNRQAAGEVETVNGAAFTVMRFHVERAETETRTLPEILSSVDRYALADAANADSPRTYSVSLDMDMDMGTGGHTGMAWGFDDHTFEMDEVVEHEIVSLNTLEAWEFVNDTSPMTMNHPIHIHGAQFQVVERSAMEEFMEGWESVRHGYVDDGWKDTVLLMPGERVKLLIRFSDYAGMYLYHCHNLEHEDGGMMRNILVE